MKFSFDDYVKENVRLDPNLQSDLTEELRESRQLCLEEFIFKRGSEDDVLAPEKKSCSGIRLGSGFIKKPITLDEFTLSRHNLQLLKGVEETLKMKVEEGLNNLIAHFTDYYMNGEERREMERYSGSFHTPYDKLLGRLKRDIVFQLYTAFHLGKLDGFQDSSRMIRLCLGGNPSDAAWHPTSMQPDSQQDVHSIDGTFIRVPLQVQSPAERDCIFEKRLRSLLSLVEKMDGVMLNLLKYRLRLLLLGRRVTGVKMESFSQMETYVRERLALVCERVYKLGHFSGFEAGQTYAKLPYNGMFEDNQTYIIQSRDQQQKWLVVDTSKQSSCTCDRCAKCIREASASNNMYEQVARTNELKLEELSKELKSKGYV